MISEEKYLGTALLAADWFVNGQVREIDNANCGRFIGTYEIAAEKISYSANWDTATAIMALLAAFKRTKDKRYLDSAKLAGEYIKSLQILDSAETRIYGAIREVTPQTLHSYPRDALTAAWGLLSLYSLTHQEDYLRRTKLFADWYLRNALDRTGWPYWDFYLNKNEVSRLQGSFQAGALGFLYDLFCITGDKRYIGHEFQTIADRYVEIFPRNDGSHWVVYNPNTKEYNREEQYCAYRHTYNDDFIYLGLTFGL